MLVNLLVIALILFIIFLVINIRVSGRRLRTLEKKFSSPSQQKIELLEKENEYQRKKICKLEMHIIKQLKEQNSKEYIEFLESKLFSMRIDPNVKDPDPLASPSIT